MTKQMTLDEKGHIPLMGGQKDQMIVSINKHIDALNSPSLYFIQDEDKERELMSQTIKKQKETAIQAMLDSIHKTPAQTLNLLNQTEKYLFLLHQIQKIETGAMASDTYLTIHNALNTSPGNAFTEDQKQQILHCFQNKMIHVLTREFSSYKITTKETLNNYIRNSNTHETVTESALEMLQDKKTLTKLINSLEPNLPKNSIIDDDYYKLMLQQINNAATATESSSDSSVILDIELNPTLPQRNFYLKKIEALFNLKQMELLLLCRHSERDNLKSSFSTIYQQLCDLSNAYQRGSCSSTSSTSLQLSDDTLKTLTQIHKEDKEFFSSEPKQIVISPVSAAKPLEPSIQAPPSPSPS